MTRIAIIMTLIVSAMAVAVPGEARLAPISTIAQVQLPNIPKIPSQGALNPPKTPTITQPRAGAVVKPPITIVGTTSPDVKVTVAAMLSVAVPLTSVQQKLGEATGTADEKGNWRIVLAFENQTLIKSKDAQVILEAIATNPLTNQKGDKARVVVKSRQ